MDCHASSRSASTRKRDRQQRRKVRNEEIKNTWITTSLPSFAPRNDEQRRYEKIVQKFFFFRRSRWISSHLLHDVWGKHCKAHGLTTHTFRHLFSKSELFLNTFLNYFSPFFSSAIHSYNFIILSNFLFI